VAVQEKVEPPKPVEPKVEPPKPVDPPKVELPKGEVKKDPPRKKKTLLAKKEDPPPAPPARIVVIEAPKPAPPPTVVVLQREEPKPPPAPPPVIIAKGQLAFIVRPWAKVQVDGQDVGVTPVDVMTLPVGPHKVRLINPDLGKDVTRTVIVPANGRETVKEIFE
jgi:hypothetical protein